MLGTGLVVGGWFAVAIITTFVNKVRSILEERHELHGDVADMLFRVKASLVHIGAVIDATERRVLANKNFMIWVQMIKEIAYEAQDWLDDFEIKRIKKSQQKKVSGVLAYMMENLVIDDDLNKLIGLLKRLDYVRKDLGSFLDLLKLNDSEEDKTNFFPTIIPSFYGRHNEKEELMSIIFPNVPQDEHFAASRAQEEIGGTPNVKVVCIVGEIGVSDPTVKEAFDLRGWAFLSHKFDSRDVFKIIECSFASEHQPFDSALTLEPLQAVSCSSKDCLTRIIMDKRFFLVLDNAQDNLRDLLETLCSVGAKGSIVMVTTRLKDTAKSIEGITRGSDRVTLGALPLGTVSAILKHHAFGKHTNVNLESISEEIACKLKGLPLLAEAIGRLLAVKLDEEHWRKVSGSKWWDRYGDLGSTNPALPSVTIIFEFLSDHLKKCLAYCSMFPSGYIFERRKLVHMWISNHVREHPEFVHESEEDKWFSELLNKSLIQPTVWENKYTVHQAIKEYVASITETGCYTFDESVRPKKNLHAFSHLAIEKRDFNASLDLSNYSNLRSVLLFGGHDTTKMNDSLVSILPKSGAMRVLDLSCIASKLARPPDFISGYKHLRYLDLSFTGVTELPDSFCGLLLLEVLGMRGCQFRQLPRCMNRLDSLLYLYAEAETVSLIHGIGQLKNLQGLEEFACSEIDGHKITELKDLNKLTGHLCISQLDKVTPATDASDAKLCDKKYIEKLVLKWGPQSSRSHDYCMQTLSYLKPNENLVELEIVCYMGAQFPAWIAVKKYFTKLQHIKLSGCERLELLPPFGQLYCLKSLILQGLKHISKIGAEFYGDSDSVFPSLEELQFYDMTKWERWLETEASQTIPRLKKLVIKSCRNLSEIPTPVFKGQLEELELSYCDKIFEGNPSYLDELKVLKGLKVYHCMGATIHLPIHSLTSLEVLSLRNCKVYFQGGKEHISKSWKFLITDCHEVQKVNKRKRLHTRCF